MITHRSASLPPARRSFQRWSVAAAAVATLVIAPSAALAASAPSGQDSTYLASNMQTSLAEITIGNLALSTSVDAGVRDLATMTLADHTAALAKATAVAQSLGVAIPTEPSPDQKAQAAQLEAASGTTFDQLYAQIQVAGHQKSVASTNTEVSSGSDPAAVQYAVAYLPTATMHLEMAQALVATVGATPTAVPAGTGGTAGASANSFAGLLVGLGLAAAFGGLVLIRRSRRFNDR